MQVRQTDRQTYKLKNNIDIGKMRDKTFESVFTKLTPTD